MNEKAKMVLIPKIEYDEFGFVKNYICPSCGAKLKLDHEDDIGQKWFKCEKCGQQTSKPKSAERKRFDKSLKRISRRRKKVSQADKLIMLCMEQKPEFFHDQTKTPYARISQNMVNIILPIRSKPFRAWLTSLLWRAEQKAPGTEAVYSALNVLEAAALFDGARRTLYNRVAPTEEGFWIDMTDDSWRAIKVTAKGWQIVDNPPILFKRFSHQKTLVEPKRGGDPWKFLDFVNVDQRDKDTRLLLLCAIISYFIPMIPHVILVLYGIQGSGKTCLFKTVRRLIDPSAVEVLTLPRDERERVQQLSHHWCAFYDNVTKLPVWMSDTLCRAATGGGFTKRELYTNDSDVIYNFKRCVGLNGINIAAQRGDLLDRSLLVGLQDIPSDKRRTEEQLLGKLENCKAEILGGFLDTLVKAIKVYPSVDPKELFRMADFTRWGCAIAVALGCKEEDFISAYEAKVKVQIEEAAHASPLATVLLDYLETNKKWEGTASRLHRALLNHAKDVGISTRQKAWPKAPHILVRQLNELTPSLKSLGWEVVTGIRTGSARIIVINTVTTVTSDNGTDEDDTDDASDASSLSSSRLINDVKELVRLTLNTQGKCLLCEVQGRMDWQVTKHNSDWGLLCSDCGFKLQKHLVKEGTEASD